MKTSVCTLVGKWENMTSCRATSCHHHRRHIIAFRTTVSHRITSHRIPCCPVTSGYETCSHAYTDASGKRGAMKRSTGLTDDEKKLKLLSELVDRHIADIVPLKFKCGISQISA